MQLCVVKEKKQKVVHVIRQMSMFLENVVRYCAKNKKFFEIKMSISEALLMGL
jgi:hypothetical protein